MALRLYELADSREAQRTLDSASVTRRWIAMYSASHDQVYAATLAVAPQRFSGFRRTKVSCKPQKGRVWISEVEYSFSVQNVDGPQDGQQSPGDNASLGPEFNFDTTAQQVHVTQSLATRYLQRAGVDRLGKGIALEIDGSNANKVTPFGEYVPSGGDVGKVVAVEAAPPNWKGGVFTVSSVSGGAWILSGSPGKVGSTAGVWGLFASGAGTAQSYKQAVGVTRDRVEGVDIFAPKLEFGETWPRRSVTLAYVKTLRYLTGRTNKSRFRGFAPGEVIYLGATGQASAAPDSGPFPWRINHKFAVSENLYAVNIADNLGIPEKRGWDYVWCAYDPSTDANKWVQTAASAYAERVYKEGEFRLLEIGT